MGLQENKNTKIEHANSAKRQHNKEYKNNHNRKSTQRKFTEEQYTETPLYPLSEWGQIRFVCPCNHDTKKISFDIIRRGYDTFYTCKNEHCCNEFSTEYHLKAMNWLNKYYKEHNTYEGFSHYFRIKDNSMRMRYIETLDVTDHYKTLLIEVINLSKMRGMGLNK